MIVDLDWIELWFPRNISWVISILWGFRKRRSLLNSWNSGANRRTAMGKYTLSLISSWFSFVVALFHLGCDVSKNRMAWIAGQLPETCRWQRRPAEKTPPGCGIFAEHSRCEPTAAFRVCALHEKPIVWLAWGHIFVCYVDCLVRPAREIFTKLLELVTFPCSFFIASVKVATRWRNGHFE